MSDSPGHPDELTEARALIAALCDDRLTPEGAAELEDLVLHNPAACRLYVRAMHLHAGLYQRAAGLAGRPADDEPCVSAADSADGADVTDTLAGGGSADSLNDAMVMPALRPEPDDVAPSAPAQMPFWESPRSEAAGRRWLWMMAAAAAVVFAVGLGLFLRHGAKRPAGRPDIAVRTTTERPSTPDTTPAESVVTLTRVIDARWDDAADPSSSTGPAAGTALAVGRSFALAGGYAELTFAGGTRVVVEGPARFTLRSPTEVLLSAGRLSALVSPDAAAAGGFVVRTPTATVVDLGTEFGVAAGGSGATDVQVFKGRVSVAPDAAPSTTGPAAPPQPAAGTRVMGEAEAVRVDRAGGLTPVAADPAAFVRTQQFAGWAAAGTASPLERWRAYSERLRRDPALAVYYTFDDPPAAPGTVRDLAAAGVAGGPHDVVVGPDAPVRGEGRWPGKGAMSFDAARRPQLLLPEFPYSTTGRLSVAGWVYARSRPEWAAVAKCRGADDPGQFSLGLYGREGDLVGRVTQRDGNRDVMIRGTNPAPLPTGRWVHVAVVADGSALHLYQDGRQIGAAPCRDVTAAPSPRSMSIGFRTGNDGRRPSAPNAGEHWDGSIDELAVFHRALSAAEVRAMYEAGKPD